MKRIIILTAAVLLTGISLPQPVRAMPANFALFAPVETELIRRLDEELTGTLDRAEKKQQRAVKSALKKFRKSSPGLSKDFQVAQQTSKKLAKAYPDEFPDAGTLGTLYSTLLDEMQIVLAESREVTAARAPDSAAKPEDILAAAVIKSDAAVTVADAQTTVDGRAKQLRKAAKALEAGNKKASKKRFGDYMTAAIEGVQFVAADITASFTPTILGSEEGDIVDVSGSFTTAGGDLCELGFSAVEITKRGTYTLSGTATASVSETPFGEAQRGFVLVPGSGSLVVKKFDLKNPWIEGTFSFEADGPDGSRSVMLGAFGVAPTISTGGGPGSQSVSYEWDGNLVNAADETIVIRYLQGTGEFFIEAGRVDLTFGLTDAVTIAATGVTVADTFAVGAGADGVFSQPPLDPAPLVTGALVITSLDVPGKSAEGTFSFTAMRDATTITIASGEFSTTQLDVQE